MYLKTGIEYMFFKVRTELYVLEEIYLSKYKEYFYEMFF